MDWQPVFGFAWFSLLRNVNFESHKNYGWSIDFVCIHTLHVNIPYPIYRFICIFDSSFSLAAAWIAFLVWILVRQKYKNLSYFPKSRSRNFVFRFWIHFFISFSLSISVPILLCWVWLIRFEIDFELMVRELFTEWKLNDDWNQYISLSELRSINFQF